MKSLRWWLLAAAVLGAGAVGTAYAAGGGGGNDPVPGQAPTPKVVAGTAAGMPPTAQLWWAVVNGDGSLARGFPQNAAGTWIVATHLATGIYQVQFKQDISGCDYSAGIGNPAEGVPNAGFITTAARAGNADAVYLETHDTTGAFADNNFHLQVAC